MFTVLEAATKIHVYFCRAATVISWSILSISTLMYLSAVVLPRQQLFADRTYFDKHFMIRANTSDISNCLIFLALKVLLLIHGKTTSHALIRFVNTEYLSNISCT